jgi:glycosyltransferase involved in cell wall biosynthesis
MFGEVVSALQATGGFEATWVGDGDAPIRTALEAGGITVTGWLPARHVPTVIAGQTVYLHTASWEAALPIAVFEAIEAGLPVVVRRIKAYRSMLPEEWQFDDVESAVRMIRELAEEPVRRRRVQEQSDLIAELRKDSPDRVLAAAYRRISTTSGTARGARRHQPGDSNRTGHRQGAPNTKVSR